MPGLADLPKETHAEIFGLLPTDQDVLNLACVCRALRKSFGDSVWLLRFRKKYERSELPHEDHLEVYKARQLMRRDFFTIKTVDEDEFRHILDLVKDLILDATPRLVHNSFGREVILSKNLTWLRDCFGFRGTNNTTRGCDLLDDDSRPTSYTLFPFLIEMKYILQIVLLHLYLDPSTNIKPITMFEESQKMIYQDNEEQPIIEQDGHLNILYFAHEINFFRHHLKAANGLGVLAHVYQGLPPSQYPRPWLGKLQEETQELKGEYRGCWASLPGTSLVHMRRNPASDMTYFDDFEWDGQDFTTLSFVSDLHDDADLKYPKKYEKPEVSDADSTPQAPHLHLDGSTKKATVKDLFVLEYAPSEVEPINGYHARTFALPAEFGIPGFQHVMMMKWDEKYQAHWIYEGVAIPGGQAILGRWRTDQAPLEDGQAYCGPFIFWRVGDFEDPDCKTWVDALAYLARVRQQEQEAHEAEAAAIAAATAAAAAATAAGDNAAGDNAAGNNAAGNNAAGDNAAGDNAAGDNAAGDNAA